VKALTIYQPYASLICPGPKRIENRTWTPPKDLIGKRIAIHAGKVMDHMSVAAHMDTLIRLFGKQFGSDQLPRGAIVGSAIVWGFVTRSTDEWFHGPIGWSLSDVRTLSEPVPCRGAQGLWDVPADIEAKFNPVFPNPFF